MILVALAVSVAITIFIGVWLFKFIEIKK